MAYTNARPPEATRASQLSDCSLTLANPAVDTPLRKYARARLPYRWLLVARTPLIVYAQLPRRDFERPADERLPSTRSTGRRISARKTGT
jgi:hypothetical protein